MNKSFTMIELIISVSILILFIATSIPQYNNFTQRLKLKSDTTNFLNILELARKKTLAGDLYDKNCTNFSGYRVQVTANNSYTLQFGCANVFQTIQTSYLSASTTISPVGTLFTFSPLGKKIEIGSPTLTVKNALINQCLDITVSDLGNGSFSEVNCP